VGSRNRTSSRPPDSQHHDGITLTDAVWMGMLPTPQSYSQGNSKSMPGLTPLDIAVRPELAKHAERAKERRKGMLPTPTQRDWRSGEASDETMNRNARPLNEVVISQTGAAGPMRLNPLFVAWMMGYPEDWLQGVECPRSKPSATP
jgi:hypothetical protein